MKWPQACQENYFYFLFDVWDLLGYNYSWTSYRAAAAIAQVTWPYLVHNKRRNNMTKKDNDPFGFNKAINWDKLEDPKVLKELEKIFIKDAPLEERKEFVKKIKKEK